MNALLVRVGIDATAGGWNAPANLSTGEFVYVPIPEKRENIRPGFARSYEEIALPLLRFDRELPLHLRGQSMHLDPDFENLTYGDSWPRSAPIARMSVGDLLVFYAGLDPGVQMTGRLLYGLIGCYVVQEVVRADAVTQEQWTCNAHTRRKDCAGDLIGRAQKKRSGRLTRCISIGEYRDRAYRVRQDLLEAWGGLSVKDGYIQRSGRLPSFLRPQMFMDWFAQQQVTLVAANNPGGK